MKHPLEKFCDRLALDIKVECNIEGIAVFVVANKDAAHKDSLVTCVYDAPSMKDAMDEAWQLFKDAFYLAEK